LVLNPATFHKIFLHQKASGSSIPNIFSLKNGLSPPWRHVCSTGSLFTGTGDDLTLAKKGGVPRFAPVPFRILRRKKRGNLCHTVPEHVNVKIMEDVNKSYITSLFVWVD